MADFVGLTFQVFSGCMQGYHLLTEARDMKKDYQYMRVQLKKEQYRLLDWANVAGIGENDDKLVVNSTNKGLLHDVLDQQRQLLQRFGKYDERYNPLRKPLVCEVEEMEELADAQLTIKKTKSGFSKRFPQEGETLLQKSLEWAKKSRNWPRQLRWAEFDKGKMEQLLIKLSSLNDFLRELLSTQQLNQLAARHRRTELQIIQLNNTMKELIEIFRAGQEWVGLIGAPQRRAPVSANPLMALMQARGLLEGPSSPTASSSSAGDGPSDQDLANMARFKALEQAINTNALTDDFTRDLQLGENAQEVTAVELSAAEIRGLDFDDENEGGGDQRSEALYHEKEVWVEWKTFEPRAFDGEPDPKVVERIRALVTLLKGNNCARIAFRAPPCLGYFRDVDQETFEDRCRFGVVFEKPAEVPPSTKPVSLLDLLRAAESGTIETPSLTERVQLAKAVAEALENLHAVNWLHKGLRSSNILFFSDGLEPEDLSLENRDGDQGEPRCIVDGINFDAPYLSGFDYARPAQNEDLTEKPPENAAFDLYRHPLVQGSRGSIDEAGNGGQSSFKKIFDVYALGVVLLEIAYWQPLDRILNTNLAKARPSATLQVRDRLLKEHRFLAHVRAHAGGVVANVVMACLIGPTALVDDANEYEFDERDAAVAAQLQTGFHENVVERLGAIKV